MSDLLAESAGTDKVLERKLYDTGLFSSRRKPLRSSMYAAIS